MLKNKTFLLHHRMPKSAHSTIKSTSVVIHKGHCAPQTQNIDTVGITKGASPPTNWAKWGRETYRYPDLTWELDNYNSF